MVSRPEEIRDVTSRQLELASLVKLSEIPGIQFLQRARTDLSAVSGHAQIREQYEAAYYTSIATGAE
jgi:hypothetical protein